MPVVWCGFTRRHACARLAVLAALGLCFARDATAAPETVPAAAAAAAAETAGLAMIASGPKIFRQHCRACHEQGKAEGGFDVDDLLAGQTVAHDVAGWRGVLERLVARDMPPEDAKRRPTEAEYRQAEAWLREQLARQEAFALAQQPRPMRRLSSEEYDRTIREVFGLPAASPAESFPPDDAFEGFTNVAEALNLSAVLVEQYLDAGEAVAKLAVVDGSQPPSQKQTFTLGYGDYAHTWRGHDPGGATGKVKGVPAWLGDHMWMPCGGPAGWYKLRLRFTPRNLAVRPGYVPHFQIRFDAALVAEGDVMIEDGKPATLECLVPSTGMKQIDLRWSNGFPANAGLRAASRPQLAADGRPAFATETPGEYLGRIWRKQAEQDPDTPYPFPYLTDASLEVEGPLYPDGWPLSRFQRDNAAAIAAGDGATIAGWLLPRLYRRPATKEEIADFAQFLERASAAYADPKVMPEPAKVPEHDGLRLAVARALVSPHFLFHVEQVPVGKPLDDHDLAARLSYFLWGGSPDDQLAKLAVAKKLRPALGREARRMLADPRAEGFVERFTTQWLGLDRLATIMPEESLYKRFDKQHVMRKEFADEPKAMMRHLLRENGSLYDLLDCDYAFLNDRLADHYHLPSLWPMWPDELPGFTAVSGGDLRKVTLPAGRRGGLVTTAAFLATTSENTRTSPVKRGAWILDRLFNRPPPPPPPNVAGVLPDDGTGETASSMVRAHVSAANCAGCHSRIDPLGLALEHYDAIGEWREQEPVWVDPANPVRSVEAISQRYKTPASMPPRFPIDDSFAMGGVKGEGANAVKDYLVANRDMFATGFTEKLATFALARRLLLTDEPQLHAIRDAAIADDFRLQTLIVALVESDLFTNR